DRGAVVLHRNVVPSNRDFVNCARLLTSVPHKLSDLCGVNRRTTRRGWGYSSWLHVADQIESRLHSTREVSRVPHSMNVHVEHVWVIPEEMIVQGRHVDSVVEESAHHRIYLILKQHQVAYHHFVVIRCHCELNS